MDDGINVEALSRIFFKTNDHQLLVVESTAAHFDFYLS
jgi:hypothetical protein